MTYKLTIPGRLMGLNEYIKLERGNRYAAASEKERIEKEIKILCRIQLRGLKIEKSVFMRYLWVEENRKRDKDNIVFARKFVQDALVGEKILKGDGWRYIVGFSDEFSADKTNPRIEITIEERSE